eukprot:scaffold62591_cov58-Phaeocystis_antarctica.AAC.4
MSAVAPRLLAAACSRAKVETRLSRVLPEQSASTGPPSRSHLTTFCSSPRSAETKILAGSETRELTVGAPASGGAAGSAAAGCGGAACCRISSAMAVQPFISATCRAVRPCTSNSSVLALARSRAFTHVSCPLSVARVRAVVRSLSVWRSGLAECCSRTSRRSRLASVVPSPSPGRRWLRQHAVGRRLRSGRQELEWSRAHRVTLPCPATCRGSLPPRGSSSRAVRRERSRRDRRAVRRESSHRARRRPRCVLPEELCCGRLALDLGPLQSGGALVYVDQLVGVGPDQQQSVHVPHEHLAQARVAPPARASAVRFGPSATVTAESQARRRKTSTAATRSEAVNSEPTPRWRC